MLPKAVVRYVIIIIIIIIIVVISLSSCHHDTQNVAPFLDPEGRSPNATLVVLVVAVVVISSLKIPKAFLIRIRAQRNFAYAFMLILPTGLPSQIFKLICN